MRVIICGAGRVGYGIAARLSAEKNTVTIVDLNADLIRKVTNELDVRGVIGHGAHPDVLKRAGAPDADMIVAVTYSDEVNMIACQVAHSLFDVPTKVARVRSQNYLQSEWNDLYSRENMPIDVIISPEIEIGKSILRRLNTPGAFESVPFADGLVRLIGVDIGEDCPIINTQILQIAELFPDLQATIVGIMRDDHVFAPSKNDSLEPNDKAYFIVKREHTARLMEIIRTPDDRARQVVIIGGGNIGAYVAKELERIKNMRVRMIESSKAVAESVAEDLKRTIMLHGDGLDAELQQEAGVPYADYVLCLTNEDETNILSAVLAKKLGAKNTGSLINELSMQALRSELNLDMVIDPRATTISSILRHARRGRIVDVYAIENDQAEVVEGEILETSPIAGKTIEDADIPKGITIGAIVRDREVIFNGESTVLRPKDILVLLVEDTALSHVERLFRVSTDFF